MASPTASNRRVSRDIIQGFRRRRRRWPVRLLPRSPNFAETQKKTHKTKQNKTKKKQIIVSSLAPLAPSPRSPIYAKFRYSLFCLSSFERFLIAGATFAKRKRKDKYPGHGFYSSQTPSLALLWASLWASPRASLWASSWASSDANIGAEFGLYCAVRLPAGYISLQTLL